MSDFNFFLNRQGIQGRKGDKGDAGFTPTISVSEKTLNSYKLKITNEYNEFETPNLIGNLGVTDNGGTYLRYDPTSGTVSTGEIDGATTEVVGGVRKSTDADLTNLSADTAVTPANVADMLPLLLEAGTDNVTITQDEATSKTKISVAGGGSGSGDVTAAGNNRFTGDNTFTGKVNIAGGALTVDGLANLNQATAQYLNAVSITSSGEVNAVSIKANGLRSDDIQTTENKKYLTEVDVDNQTIQVVNGKLHANLDELGNEVNDLTGRVTTNEADISAMKTGKQNKLTAGTNVTLTDLSDGTVRIDAAGGGGSTDSYTKSETNALLSEKNDNIFDISKFTVVGNPTITDDGVASGFSTSNYVKIPYVADRSKPWTQHIEFTTGSDVKTEQRIWIEERPTLNPYTSRIILDSSKRIAYRLTSDGASYIGGSINRLGTHIIQPNTKYILKVEFTGTHYNMYLSTNGSEYELDYTIADTAPIQNFPSMLGFWREHPFLGSIDLKQFSITVDGKEVFSGLMSSTKPIYDAIKANNTELSEFKTETSNDFSAVNSALNEKANLSDLGLKQNILISGTNIKTINGQSVLGEGNITVGGGTPTVIDGGNSLAS